MNLKKLLNKLGIKKTKLTEEELKITSSYEAMVAEYGVTEADQRIIRALS